MCKKVWPPYFLFFFEQVLVILLIITFYQKKGTYINCSKLLLPLPQRVVSQAIKVIPPKLNDDKTERDNSKMKAPMLSFDFSQASGKYATEIKKAAKKLLKQPGIRNETIYEIRKKLVNKHLIGKCKYCDPAWSVVSNFAEAVKGYDVPMGNPYPELGRYDPGIRRKIFGPMFMNKEGFRQRAKYITANAEVKCDSVWSEEIFHNYESYVNWKVNSSTTGYGVELVKDLNINVPVSGLVNVRVKLPTFFTRSSEYNTESIDLKMFLDKEEGSIAVSQAKCITHHINIAMAAKNKRFTKTFLDAVLSLQLAADKEKAKQDEIFRDFVNNYGTHFSTNTYMGVKVYAERRYSKKEKKDINDADLKRCNTENAIKVVQFQMDQDTDGCKQRAELSQRASSSNIKRTVISTYGTFISKDVEMSSGSKGDDENWSKLISSLMSMKKYTPRVLKRELVLILRLFNELDFPPGRTHKGVEFDMPKILQWYVPAMANYCQIFNISCSNNR